MRTLCKAGALIALALAVSLVAGTAFGASDFPSKPVTLIVHTGPGGGSDIFARTLAAAFDQYKLLPQPIVVENKPGGSGAVAFAYVASKKGDPYFMVTSVASFMTTPLLGRSPVNFRDFTPLANFAFDENLLQARADSKFKTIQDVIAAAKANPQTITVGGSVRGGPESICTYQIEKAAGIKLNFVSFNSGAEVVAALLGGHIDLTVGNLGESAELLRAGKIRNLGVLAQKRMALAPDIPTLKEQGLDVPGAPNPRGVSAPGRIPAEARKIMEEALYKYTQTDIYKKYSKDNMLNDAWMDSVTYTKWLGEQSARYEAIFKDMGVIK